MPVCGTVQQYKAQHHLSACSTVSALQKICRENWNGTAHFRICVQHIYCRFAVCRCEGPAASQHETVAFWQFTYEFAILTFWEIIELSAQQTQTPSFLKSSKPLFYPCIGAKKSKAGLRPGQTLSTMHQSSVCRYRRVVACNPIPSVGP